MADAQKVADTVNEIVAEANAVLEIIAAVDPQIGGEGLAAGKVAGLLAGLVMKALAAYSAASDTPITPETVAALLPNPEPLSPPDMVS
jgi:hypothetical protein